MDVREMERAGQVQATRSTQVNIRIELQQLALIDHAAEALGKNRSAFMLETALQTAEAVLLDKRLFAVDEETYGRFMSRLDAPPMANPKLQVLLRSKSPWEA